MRRSATALFRLIDRLCPPAGDPAVESRIPAAIPGQNPWETSILAILTVFQAGTWIVLGWTTVFPANNWSWIALSIALGPAIFLGLHLWNFTIGAIAQLLLGGGSLRVTRLNLLGVYHSRHGFGHASGLGTMVRSRLVALGGTEPRRVGPADVDAEAGDAMIRRISIIVFGLSHILALALCTLGHGLAAFLVLTAGNALVWIPTLIPNHSLFGRCITRFATDKPEVWITIDDGPDRQTRRRFSDLLDEHDAKATFFVVGERSARHPDLIREIHARGHGIANHSHRHHRAWFWAFPGRILRREINEASSMIETITGELPTLFRPPVGMKNPLVQPILDAANLTHIGWSIRGFDGVTADPNRVIERIRPGLESGAIVLIHQGGRTTEGELLAPAVLQQLLVELNREGLRAVIPPAGTY